MMVIIPLMRQFFPHNGGNNGRCLPAATPDTMRRFCNAKPRNMIKRRSYLASSLLYSVCDAFFVTRRTVLKNMKHIWYSILVCLVLAVTVPTASRGAVEGTVPGMIRMYLYEEGTGLSQSGANDIHAVLGDTISVDVFIRNPQQVPVSALEIFLSLDNACLEIIPQGYNEDKQFYYGQPKPFIQGSYLRNAFGQVPPWGNNTHNDSLFAADNGIDGWQMDYIEITPPSVGQPRNYSNLLNGTVCTFKLLAVAPCDSVILTLDRDQYYQRVSSYHEPDANDNYFFQSFSPCYISVTGIMIDPPLPDITMGAGGTDTSLDLDDHIGNSSLPDSLITWTASGNDAITVAIDPDTRVVTFGAADGFQGFEDVIFTVGMDGSPTTASDTLRVTVNSPPQLLADAIPDTLIIIEDIRTGVLDLREIVIDADDTYDRLTWAFTTGENLTAETAADSLFLAGAENYNGMTSLQIAVRDPFMAADSLTVPVIVTPVNDPPTLAGLPDVSLIRTGSYQFDMNAYLADVDGDKPIISWREPADIIVEMTGTLITLRGRPGFLGAENVVFTGTDPAGLAASDSMAVTVTRANNPPVWAVIPKVGFAQGGADSTIVLWDYVADPDDPDSLLAFEITGDDDVDAWSVDAATGRLHLSDTDNMTGWDRLMVTASDPDGNMASQPFLAFIAPADGTPIVAAIPDTTMIAGAWSEWIDLDYYYYDIDNTDAEMTWSWSRQAGADSTATVTIHPVTRRVTLTTLDSDLEGVNKIIFTATDPTGRSGDDICIVTVVGELARPVLDLPAKVGFISGGKYTIDLDDFTYDLTYQNSQLLWSWRNNVNTTVALGDSSALYTRPATFSGPVDWIGWERMFFTARNPMNGATSDTLTVFSVPADGTPVAGGLTGVTLRAGGCVYLQLDNYVFDADSPDYSLTWSASNYDSITVDIDPLTHIAHICAHSETWEGSETPTFMATDPDGNDDTMIVPVTVTDAVLRNVFSSMIFRNPMQEDYMDLFVTSTVDLAALPTLDITAQSDSTRLTAYATGTRYYYGRYVLPLDISVGSTGTGTIIITGRTAKTGMTVQDTTYFAYGRIGASGGKIALGGMRVDVPRDAVSEPVFLTLTDAGENTVAKPAQSEVLFSDAPYVLSPAGLATHRPMRVTIKSVGHSAGAGIYRLAEQGWEFIGAGVRERDLFADTDVAGTFTLGYDTTPPVVERIGCDGSSVMVSVRDGGSGVDAATVVATAGGIMLDVSCDGAGMLTIPVTALEDAGMAEFTVSAADRVGNGRSASIAVAGDDVPGLLFVEQNSPNPFNPDTSIAFTLTGDARVSVTVYDMLGRRVRTLLDERIGAGRHVLRWDATDDGGRTVASGVYLYRVSRGAKSFTRKMLFVR